MPGTIFTVRPDRTASKGRRHCHGGTSVFAAKQSTSVIPIVFATVADPLGSGLVANLARPGGNVTGLSLTSPELAGCPPSALMRQIGWVQEGRISGSS
jgi:ABC transporter substrate binding protein